MKKIVLSVALIFWVAYLMAQQERIVQQYASKKKFEKAKTEVDTWLADPQLIDEDKPLAYLWKMLVYSQLYIDPYLSPKYPEANDQALDAFNKYLQLDPSLKLLREQNFSAGIGSLYSGSFERGKNYFQDKQWYNSFKYFSESERLGNFLLTNKLSSTTATIDTITVLYTGYAAQNAKMPDTAVKYYGRLADLKIAGPDYEDMYKYLVEYYSDKKDDANLKKYLAIAKELYPADNALWTQYEMNAMTANSSLTDLLQKYHQDVVAGAMSEDKLTGYAEALATTDKTQLQGMDSTQRLNVRLAAAEAFAKAFELNNTNGLYAFNTGVIYYGIYSDLDNRYNAYSGGGAALKAIRTEIAKQEMAYADTSSEWLEKAYPILKAKTDRTKGETASLNRTVAYLANIYLWQRDQTKANGNAKYYDKYDALYKKYDAEYNIYTDISVSGKGVIKLLKINGVYTLNVTVNDKLDWQMIFDTGASDVSISLTEALYMSKHDLLKPDDFIGTASYQNAEGKISTGHMIILRKIDLGGGIILYDVRASIVESLDAPLLLGQSALEQFNTITFDKANSLLIVK